MTTAHVARAAINRILALQKENASQRRELVSLRKFADKVRATSTSLDHRTTADILLSPKRLETV